MYQQQRALFFYCVSPVHMGAGDAVGLIDNPIQRERHTGYPLFAGSGLKGALRHRFQADGWDENSTLLDRIFGPKNSEHAGAVSLGDAQLLAFPVRCTRRAYVYVTSPTALARVRRLLEHLQVDPGWTIPEELPENCCGVVPETKLAGEKKLSLEVFQYEVKELPELEAGAAWLARHALPAGDGYDFFRDKLKTDLVLLPEEDFTHYVKNATVVEPHVRIDDETGAAQEGGLFYTENLPPESLLLAPLMVSKERKGGADAMSALDVMHKIIDGPDGKAGLNGLCLQVGGDATTGRGQVVVSVVTGGPENDDTDT